MKWNLFSHLLKDIVRVMKRKKSVTKKFFFVIGNDAWQYLISVFWFNFLLLKQFSNKKIGNILSQFFSSYVKANFQTLKKVHIENEWTL